jgi:rod shape-determining protein MreD
MLMRAPLLFAFFLAVIATTCGSVFLPHIRLHTFAPFLALLYSRCSRMSSFWISSLCGLLIDVLGSELRFGVHALSFSVATLFLYSQKKHFFNDKPLALSLFTFQISLIITLILFLFSYLSNSLPSISIKWMIFDFILMSFFDSLYAFIWFSLPLFLYGYLMRIGIRSWISKISFSFLKKKKCSE